jgi:Tfp pilus assembly protein PilZ
MRVDMEKGEQGSDQRKHLRKPLLILKVKLDDGRRAFFGYANNISRSGLFISSSNPRIPGTSFQIEIPLPEPINRKVICTCEVVWKREYAKNSSLDPGMGLKFTNMPEDVAAAIDVWVSSKEVE